MITIEKLYEYFLINPVISTDSRNIIPGSIFFALKGPSFNGNSFSEMALSKGAAFAVIDDASWKKGPEYILVDDVLTSLQRLANFHRKKLNMPFLAITGSNGKTTTKELVRNVLSKKYKTAATKGNLNNHIGVPITILSIKSEMEFAVIEMGANHLNEINSYCKIAEPDFGLITNVGKAHLEGFGGFEGVKRGKGELYEWIAEHGQAVFINSDNVHLKSMAEHYKLSKTISYGTKQEYYCTGNLLTEQPLLNISWKCGSNKGSIVSRLVGSYNFENILSAVCIGNYFGVNPDEINAAISEYVPDNSRSQIITKGSNTIILDAYNANPTSMEAALVNFEKIDTQNKIVFIGDMAELGEESALEHRRIASLLKYKNYKQIIFVGKNFGEFADKLIGIHFENSEEAAEWIKKHPIQNSYILIKGSRSTKMEKVLEAL